jgi:hypothetical protein
MASYSQTPTGRTAELQRLLGERGLDSFLVDAALGEPALVSQMLATLRILARTAYASPADLFRGNKDVYDAFMARAKWSKWGFTQGQFKQLRSEMPPLDTVDITGVISLEVWLGDLQRTYHELDCWSTGRDPRLPIDGNAAWSTVRSTHRRHFGDTPTVRWVKLDLSSRLGSLVELGMAEVPRCASGYAVLATAALHPEWFYAQGGLDRPCVWVPSIEAVILEDSSLPTRYTPLRFDAGYNLGATEVHNLRTPYMVHLTTDDGRGLHYKHTAIPLEKSL